MANRKKGYRRVTWREGTQRPLSARFAFHRVRPFHDDGKDPAEREAVWLICEWRDDDVWKKRRIIRLIKERWRTERVYQDLKGELGFDHYEGRRFPGWHHHVSVALCCYAFVIAERVRRVPPSARRQESHRPLEVAA